ncbi:diadenylate cyclase CdaA [Treponema sp.]|uniref:diadenylate cyclase CdaA n=1 Tax=Treponema sp. TaxID=166 RepID=UPI00298D6BFD|nr:diadenylate cyclase CdaA [Treponema sp.]MCR5612270.1 diadenylate cyclase CdaA [Treponema sp.]
MLAVEQLRRVYSHISPVLDVLIIAFILYKAYELLMKTNGIQILRSAILIGFFYLVASFLKLETTTWILNIIAPGLLVCFVIVFQPELRKIVLKLGQKEWFSFGNRSKHTHVDAVLIAADQLSKMKRGMLAVFVRHTKLDDYIETGTRLDAKLSSALLYTIFSHDTPLHDAACVIQGGKIIAAGCFLPLSEQYDIRKTFGTRHRAALGLAEQTDAVVLIVSEETGAISLAYDSKLHYDLSINELTNTLEELLEITSDSRNIEDTIDESRINS